MPGLFDFLGKPPEGLGRTPVSEREELFGGIRKHPADVVGTNEWINEQIFPMITGALGGEGALAKALARKKMRDSALAVFEIFGAKPKSMSPKDLGAMYKDLSKLYHPDVRGPESTGTMQVINKAWDVLKKNTARMD